MTAAPALPALIPDLPDPGRRMGAGPFAGSSDALALAALGRRAAALTQMVAVISADARSAQRLAEEIPWFAPELRVALLPDWETLPYDHFSPHQDLVSERLATLYRVSRGECDVLVVAATTALYRLAPPSYLAAFTFFLTQGETLDVDALRSQLALAGYSHVTQVVSPGEFSVRGGLIDLFPMGSALPYRIDLFDADIETIKTFDVDTQRTLYPVQNMRLLPAREFPLDDAGRARFRSRFREAFEGDPSKSALYKDISNGIAPGGIEYYLPLFFEATATIADYLPPTASIALHGDVAGAVEHFWQDTDSRYRLLRGDKARPLLPPTELFLPADAFNGTIKSFGRVELRGSGEGPTRAPPPVQVDRRADDPLFALKRFLAATDLRVAIVAESAGRRETMQHYFAEYGLHPALSDGFGAFLAATERVMLVAAPVAAGFAWAEGGVAFITETELYAGVVRRTAREAARRSNVDAMVRDLSEVRIGDPVVHEEHGIGRYLGLLTLDLGDGPNEFLQLVYANDAKLYVPVSNLHLISRYSGASPDAAPLHELGSGQWEKAKKKAAQQAHDTAAELLNLYAQRAARQGYAFAMKPHDYEAFAEGFGFEETPDQAATIEAVIADMTSGKPMDRLVCGDVGFGKTEVALRAAFVAAMAGTQVALVCPTTLLARQHFTNFVERFKGFPVNIGRLSRLVPAGEAQKTRDGLASGHIDIVIGTHAVIAKSVEFKQLGLVIVDEEQRFGVVHKERLKQLKADVHVLTLTATPIPRTLQMAMSGLRELSVIQTPPVDRLAVRTYVAPWDAVVLREALLREHDRGGQSFFVVPRIKDLPDIEEFLRNRVPEIKYVVAHGQMTPTEVEDRMSAFYDRKYDVLLSTTIVESGLDIPSANTLIIHRADRFGLAQLYQLRGRVGRAKTRAYAYLTTPEHGAITDTAEKRLKLLGDLDTLGAGFQLASHDLDIRGAGNLVGDEQSGHIREVGFELYQSMLEEAILVAKAEGAGTLPPREALSPTITVDAPILIPEDYVPDLPLRMALYRRLNDAEDRAALDAFAAEMIDRFGPLPPETANLVLLMEIKANARIAGIAKLDVGTKGALVSFHSDQFANVPGLIAYVERLKGRARLRPDNKLSVSGDWVSTGARLNGALQLSKGLGKLARQVA